eukprot:3054729-Rhodomonas_salina.1
MAWRHFDARAPHTQETETETETETMAWTETETASQRQRQSQRQRERDLTKQGLQRTPTSKKLDACCVHSHCH